METKVPPKPRVRHPVSWSCAVQDIVAHAKHSALCSLVEKMHGDVKGFAWTSASCRVSEAIEADVGVAREFYEIACHFIAKCDPPRDGASDKGLPVDRAEARLRLWLDLFARPPVPSCGNRACRFASYEWHDSACPNVPNPGEQPHRKFAERILGKRGV